MRALVYDGSRLRLDRERAAPAAAPGEALVAPLRAAISATDLRTAGRTGGAEQAGAARGFAGVLGQEFVGVVRGVNIPADAPAALRGKSELVGRRVVASPNVACAACDLCRGGLSAHCRAREVLGAWQRDGCLADLVRVPIVNLVPVPDAVDDDRAALALPLARGLHAALAVRLQSKPFVTVLGDDALALLTAQALARLNASVRLLGRRADHVALCEKWGVRHRLVDDAGRRQDQDVVVDCSGSSAGLRLALQLVRPRGTVVLKADRAFPPGPAGLPGPDTPDQDWRQAIDLSPAIANEVQIVGSRDGPIPDALGMLLEDRVDVLPLITRRFRFDDVCAAVDHAARPESLKVLVEF